VLGGLLTEAESKPA
jgi:hypothetical protein